MFAATLEEHQSRKQLRAGSKAFGLDYNVHTCKTTGTIIIYLLCTTVNQIESVVVLLLAFYG